MTGNAGADQAGRGHATGSDSLRIEFADHFSLVSRIDSTQILKQNLEICPSVHAHDRPPKWRAARGVAMYAMDAGLNSSKSHQPV